VKLAFVNRGKIEVKGWLPDMDLNHDKQIQSLLCYRYTIGQAGAVNKLESFPRQSSHQTAQTALIRRNTGPRPAATFVGTEIGRAKTPGRRAVPC
jgi:hypothetical protein